MKIIILTFWLYLVLCPVINADPTIKCNKQKICEIQHLQEGQLLNLSSKLGRNFDQYLYIKISNSHIIEIPIELSAAFPNVKNMSAVGCSLKVIRKEAISTKLHHLNLRSNEIAVLEDDMFETGRQLRIIDLSQNWIVVVARNAFRFLAELNTLDLSNNRIGALENDTFVHLKQLVTLKLGHNAIQVVEAGLFCGNHLLTTLEMQANKIQIMPDHLFDRHEKLHMINFADNLIDTVKPQAFEGLIDTNTINLSGNRVQTWGNVAFSGTIALLDLSNNLIESIDLDGMRISVVHLQLNYNKIRTIEASNYNSKMSILNLAGNHLTSVNVIRKLRCLEIVSLSDNPGLKLQPHTIVGLQSLKALYLKKTGLTKMIGDEKWFSDLPSLEELDLSNNNLQKLDVNAFATLQNLSKLNLDSTNITEVLHYERLLIKFPNLNGVMLLGNRFSCGYLDKMVDSLERRKIVHVYAGCNPEVQIATTQTIDYPSWTTTDAEEPSTTEPINPEVTEEMIVETTSMGEQIPSDATEREPSAASRCVTMNTICIGLTLLYNF